MAASRLDQLVKGAPPPDAHLPFNDAPAPLPKSYLEGSKIDSRPTTPDPLSTLPSSPPQIYLNLLILESSLRAQYLALRERRRQNTFFLLLLALWVVYFFYALFMRPREDGSGVGGSVYWMVETAEKVAFMGGIVTGILVWGTGQWERGMRWPRRWFAVANRGLRGMNTKIVLIRGPWWKELLSLLSFIFPYSSLFQSPKNFQYVELHSSEKRAARQHHSVHDHDSDSAFIEEDLAPGVGMNTEQTTGRKRMKDVHYSAEEFRSENVNEPVKREVGYGGFPLPGHVSVGMSIPITNISTIDKCLVLPRPMMAELAAILAPTHNRFILGAQKKHKALEFTWPFASDSSSVFETGFDHINIFYDL
ncbi:uncharacterized protein BHQ10_007254 [Talaromyces amestolkiae]|uniref:Spo7-like protein n=1 Tax=Talaromyces amestolkiae TaxID=1196081 RepID=A0A364L619_TALAM|nr:uncharacterized protein BHQ10_007254 [Talaromyces amestolkiae]RAO71242.1 hypothetical protein BHQ10_007254 [Talaromyces amestolkiae]